MLKRCHDSYFSEIMTESVSDRNCSQWFLRIHVTCQVSVVGVIESSWNVFVGDITSGTVICSRLSCLFCDLLSTICVTSSKTFVSHRNSDVLFFVQLPSFRVNCFLTLFSWKESYFSVTTGNELTLKNVFRSSLNSTSIILKQTWGSCSRSAVISKMNTRSAAKMVMTVIDHVTLNAKTNFCNMGYATQNRRLFNTDLSLMLKNQICTSLTKFTSTRKLWTLTEACRSFIKMGRLGHSVKFW